MIKRIGKEEGGIVYHQMCKSGGKILFDSHTSNSCRYRFGSTKKVANDENMTEQKNPAAQSRGRIGVPSKFDHS
jgi:hypothetical protein